MEFVVSNNREANIDKIVALFSKDLIKFAKLFLIINNILLIKVGVLKFIEGLRLTLGTSSSLFYTTVKPFVQSPPKRPRSVQFHEGTGQRVLVFSEF